MIEKVKNVFLKYLKGIQVNVSSEVWPVVLPIVGGFLILLAILAICWWRYVKIKSNVISETQTDGSDKTNAGGNRRPKTNMKRNAVHPIDNTQRVNQFKTQLDPPAVFTGNTKPLPHVRVSPILMSVNTDSIRSVKSHNDIYNIYKSSVNDPHIHQTGRRISSGV